MTYQDWKLLGEIVVGIGPQLILIAACVGFLIGTRGALK